MTAPNLSADAQSLVHLDLDVAAFGAEWKHCDQVANYLARLLSFGRADTFLYANLLSTVLNELLETVFRQHQPTGTLGCTLRRDGALDRIELEIPATDEQRDFYRDSVAAAQSTDVGALFARSLLGDEAPARSIGLLELASDYGARLWIEPSAEALRLIIDVCLEPSQPATAHA